MNEDAESLPRAGEADVSEDKVRGYLLNPDHATGKHKFRVFQSAFAVSQDDWEYMREQLLDGVQTSPVTGTRQCPGCTTYTVPMTVTGLNGVQKRVVTAWKLPDDGRPPSLVTAYLDERAG